MSWDNKALDLFLAMYKKGDLIYGLTGARLNVIQGVEDRHGGVITQNGAAYTQDQINNAFMGTSSGACDLDGNMLRGAGAIHARLDPDDAEIVKAFRKFMESHSKYNPLKKSGADRSATRTREACKAGLKFSTKQGKRIHFILDRINMDWVVNKTGPMDQMSAQNEAQGGEKLRDITGAELRWLYRHRADRKVMSRVMFWEDGVLLDHPPWEDPNYQTLWRPYVPKSETGSQNALATWFRRFFS